jgi:UPF0755 protein
MVSWRKNRSNRSHNWVRAQRPDRKPAPLRFLFGGILLVVLVIAAGGSYVYYEIHTPQGSGAALVPFSVHPGDNDTSIADRLQAKGLIHNTLLFRLDARLRGLASVLRPGYYTLHRNMSIDQIVRALAVFHDPLIRITIPEGWRAGQIAARLQQHGISGAAFLHAIEHPHFNVGFPTGRPAGSSLEGFLFPDTYYVPRHYSGTAFARLMVQQFTRMFTPAMRRMAHRAGYSVFQIVTIASIIEREAHVAAERRIIASVYYNRLHAHMLLQADPTVQYALVQDRNWRQVRSWWPVLKSQAEYRSVHSAYNTYLHPGLPPGPICNPGLASLKAALAPAQTRYFFFVATGHGRHVFARTYAQQLANIAKYSR